MLVIAPLDSGDVDDALRLSAQSGWNQVAADWRRFLSLSPDGCFGGYVGGDLVGTTCTVTYDDVMSWVGMVLVDEAHRKQGYGTELFERGLAHALDAGASVGLDATEFGAPLYREHGFRETVPVERWTGPVEAVGRDRTSESGGPERATVLQPKQWADLCELDADTLGVDRTAFLDHLLSEVGVSALGVSEGDELVAYAVVRPGREHPQLGPAVAPDAAHLSALLDGVTTLLTEPAVVVDVVPDDGTVETLRAHGLTRRRRLSRMVHGDASCPLDGDGVRAITGFAWG